MYRLIATDSRGKRFIFDGETESEARKDFESLCRCCGLEVEEIEIQSDRGSGHESGEFICSTIGMRVFVEDVGCSRWGSSKMVRCEYYRLSDGRVRLEAVDGETLEPLKSVWRQVISREQFADRPWDPYNDQEEFWWAMSVLGLCDDDD